MREHSKFVFGDTKFKLTVLHSLRFELLNAKKETESTVDSKIKRHATCNDSYEM